MRRIAATARTLGLVGLCATTAAAQDDAPPLSAPSGGAEASAPGELPPVLEAAPMLGPENRPTMTVPGLGAPRSTAPGLGLPSTADDLPPLVGPSEPLGSGSGLPLFSAPANGTAPGRGSRTLGLETVPPETMDGLPGPSTGPNPRRGPATLPAAEPTAPRRGRFFGRMFPPPPSPRPRAASRADDSITVEPRSDPATDAALKRRLEQQVRELGGNRIRSYDVKVVGREVYIHARVTRFWHRRAVKHAIESMPGLSGYKATVTVED